jgi:hypothetical protein
VDDEGRIMKLELTGTSVAIDSTHPSGHFTTKAIGQGTTFPQGAHSFVLSRELENEVTLEQLVT